MIIKKNNFTIILIFLAIFFVSIFCFAEESEYTIKLAHHHNVGGYADNIANKFKEIVEEKTNGRVKVEVYPGGQLGQETEAAEGVLMGTLDMAVISTVMFDNMIPGTAIFALPLFISWKSNEQMCKLFNDSNIFIELNNKMNKKEGMILGTFTTGYRHMMFKDKEVKTLEEFKGLKMRSPESELFINMYKALGANPTSVTWGETYTALQTGVVVGLDCSASDLITMGFQEVTKYCLLTHHMIGTMSLVINKSLFDKFPEDIQDIISEAGKEAANYVTEQVRNQEEEIIESLKEQGMIFNELSNEEKVKFIKAMEPVIDNWAKSRDALTLVEELKRIAESQ